MPEIVWDQVMLFGISVAHGPPPLVMQSHVTE